MNRWQQIGAPTARPDLFNLFQSTDRDPSLARIGFRLRECYGSRSDELVPERFARLLDRLDGTAPPAT